MQCEWVNVIPGSLWTVARLGAMHLAISAVARMITKLGMPSGSKLSAVLPNTFVLRSNIVRIIWLYPPPRQRTRRHSLHPEVCIDNSFHPICLAAGGDNVVPATQERLGKAVTNAAAWLTSKLRNNSERGSLQPDWPTTAWQAPPPPLPPFFLISLTWMRYQLVNTTLPPLHSTGALQTSTRRTSRPAVPT
jgi:hypothetical protein